MSDSSFNPLSFDRSSPDPQRVEERAEMLVNRVRKNLKKRRKWAKRKGVTCFRLYDRDIPEVPLIIDVYEDHLHASILPSGHVTESEAEAIGGVWLEHVRAALEISSDRVYLKTRVRQKGASQYKPRGEQGVKVEVNEAGLKFWVNFTDYLDTGLFLDHRITRGLVAEEAKGRRLLNLFAYTGSFTVYAAAAGAIQTTTVDSTSTYLKWTEDNLRLNKLNGRQHRLVREDVRSYLQRAYPSGDRFDLVVLDPPTFSNSKGAHPPFDVSRHHALLFEDIYPLMPSGGILYFSSNARRFSLHEDLIRKWIIEEITEDTTPLDFKQQRPHRCWRCVKRS